MLSPRVAELISGIAGIRPPGEPIFPLRYGGLERPWRRCLTALGIRYRSPYQTKHTFATLKLIEGESPAIVARNLGISLATLEKHYAAALQKGRLLVGRKPPVNSLSRGWRPQLRESKNAPDRIRTCNPQIRSLVL
jgi:integrase